MAKENGLEKLVGEALRRKDVSKAYEEWQGNPETFKTYLKGYLERSFKGAKKLKKFSKLLDRANKLTVPIDSAVDYFGFLGGLGAATKATYNLFVKFPAYLLYDGYYTLKTHDVLGGLSNLGYEALSWFVPGSLTHLIGKYSKQVEKYIVKDGSEKFLKFVKETRRKKGLVKKIEESREKQKEAA